MNFNEEEADVFIKKFKTECEKICQNQALLNEAQYCKEALFVLVSEGEYNRKTDEVRYKLTIHTHMVEDADLSPVEMAHCTTAKQMIQVATHELRKHPGIVEDNDFGRE